MTTTNFLTDQIRQLEKALATHDVRTSGVALCDILHPEFEEFGKSGRRLDRTQIIDDLTTNTNSTAYSISDFSVECLAENVALATYRIPPRTIDGVSYPGSLRSSLWVNNNGTWQLRFHQGTATPD